MVEGKGEGWLIGEGGGGQGGGVADRGRWWKARGRVADRGRWWKARGRE